MWSNNPLIFSIYFQYIEKGYLSKQTVAKKSVANNCKYF